MTAAQSSKPDQDIVLLADRPGPWRDSVAEALTAEGHPPEFCTRGEELQRVLLDPQPEPKIAVIGSELEREGGLEALYRAHLELKKAKKHKFGRSVLLVSETRSDIELLELLRRRGVDDFVYRDDPVEKTVARLLNLMFAKRRSSLRSAVRFGATIKVEDRSVPSVIEDLSIGGARIAVTRKDLPVSLSTGETVVLRFEVQQVQVSCRAEIRRLSMRKVLFSERVIVGAQFVQLDAATTEAIKQTVDWATQQFVVSDYLSIKPF